MPHSSGGGSHGGGFHGGSHGSSSSNHVSTHYYPGARRYRRVYRDGRKTEEYVYASSKPSKTGIGMIIFIAIFGAVFMGLTFISIKDDTPKRLSPKYSDDPAIHDDIGVIGNEEGLLTEMKKFHETTRICPVIYTVTNEKWLGEPYGNLKDYTMSVYTGNFSDEQHFVIVYSVPESQIKNSQGKFIKVPDYSWEAVQGNETDPVITKSFMRRFGNAVQDDLEAGKGVDEAFISGFKKANSQAEVVKPFSAKWIAGNLSNLFPLLFVGGFFFIPLFFMIRSYRRDKNVDYEEVPLEAGDTATATDLTGIPGGAYRSRSVSYSVADPDTPKIVKIISIVFITPFVLIGLGTIISGIAMFRANPSNPGGIFSLVFGLIWTFISLFILIKVLIGFNKAAKKKEVPLTAEYPKAEMPTADYPDVKPAAPENERTGVSAGFYSSSYNSARSDYEAEDEEYKRMKRKGYE